MTSPARSTARDAAFVAAIKSNIAADLDSADKRLIETLGDFIAALSARQRVHRRHNRDYRTKQFSERFEQKINRDPATREMRAIVLDFINDLAIEVV